ncbi:6138_t:CDS:2 [Gigaspora margarita]|uniref:6138_t:CDS:1 n=1 Tax=Gigaspora margarita TaxID=4874 RepID=A0ABM8W653_GIGMA|nr:6138_t:CDS:2 [Gigaspora margarita]
MDSSCPTEPAPLIPVQVEWYSFLDFGTIEVEVDKFASDADNVIDEASNTYLQESNAQLDPWGYITNILDTEGLLVSDLFDYLYEEQQEPYQIS